MADLRFATFFAFQDAVRNELRGRSENWQAALAASAEFKKSGRFLLARFRPRTVRGADIWTGDMMFPAVEWTGRYAPPPRLWMGVEL